MSEVFNLKVLSISILIFALQACSKDEQEKVSDKSNEPSNVVNVELKPEKTPESEKVETPQEEAQSTVDELIPEPKPELFHEVVTQEQIYKNWPYQEEMRNLPTQTSVEPEPETIIEKATEAVEEKATEVKEAVVEKVSVATGASKDMVSNVVDKVVPAPTPAATGGAEHVINAKGLTAFDKPILYVAPGDTIHFKKLNGGHNSESVFTPEGAEGWKGAMNKNISVTLTVSGMYGYICLPHAGLGMNGVIVVGDAGDKEAVMEKLRGLEQTDPARKLLGKVNKVKPENYVK